jgi:hypothetical protein
MALEFVWHGDKDVGTEKLRTFIAATTGGTKHSDGTVFLDGMYVMARASSDEDDVVALFGFEERFSVTFRFSNLADRATAEHNTAVMVHVVIAFAQSCGGSGVLLVNGETNVLQYGADGIVFDSSWEEWTDNGETAPLLTQFASRVLSQPLL